MPGSRVESGCIGLKIFGLPHQTKPDQTKLISIRSTDLNQSQTPPCHAREAAAAKSGEDTGRWKYRKEGITELEGDQPSTLQLVLIGMLAIVILVLIIILIVVSSKLGMPLAAISERRTLATMPLTFESPTTSLHPNFTGVVQVLPWRIVRRGGGSDSWRLNPQDPGRQHARPEQLAGCSSAHQSGGRSYSQEGQRWGRYQKFFEQLIYSWLSQRGSVVCTFINSIEIVFSCFKGFDLYLPPNEDDK